MKEEMNRQRKEKTSHNTNQKRRIDKTLIENGEKMCQPKIRL
jgi:hypothetical protein